MAQYKEKNVRKINILFSVVLFWMLFWVVGSVALQEAQVLVVAVQNG